jgi:hypothetical protein
MACYCTLASWDTIMSNPLLRTLFGQVELRPVAPPPGAPEGMQAYVLLPDLDELLGVPGFGLRDPILLRGRRPQGRPVGAIAGLLFH